MGARLAASPLPRGAPLLLSGGGGPLSPLTPGIGIFKRSSGAAFTRNPSPPLGALVAAARPYWGLGYAAILRLAASAPRAKALCAADFDGLRRGLMRLRAHDLGPRRVQNAREGFASGVGCAAFMPPAAAPSRPGGLRRV